MTSPVFKSGFLTYRLLKRVFAYSVMMIFLSAFTCDNEPLEGEFFIEEETPNNCEEAQQVTANAEFAFENANDGNYETLCQAYKNALQNQLSVCGDNDGELQGLIDSLGDCTN